MFVMLLLSFQAFLCALQEKALGFDQKDSQRPLQTLLTDTVDTGSNLLLLYRSRITAL